MRSAVPRARSRYGAGERSARWPPDPVQPGRAPARAAEQQQRGVQAAKEVLQGERTLPQRVGSDFSESDSDASWNIIHVMQVDNSCTYA